MSSIQNENESISNHYSEHRDIDLNSIMLPEYLKHELNCSRESFENEIDEEKNYNSNQVSDCKSTEYHSLKTYKEKDMFSQPTNHAESNEYFSPNIIKDIEKKIRNRNNRLNSDKVEHEVLYQSQINSKI